MEPITRRETLLNQIADNTSGNAGSIDMEPITREEVYLKQIADNTASGGGGGGGSDLPAVTSDDNGDVLTVVGGAWDKAAPSGSSGLVISLTADIATQTMVMNKTFQEVWDAFSAGQAVVIKDYNVPGAEALYSINTMTMETLEIAISGDLYFTADTVNDYPQYTWG